MNLKVMYVPFPNDAVLISGAGAIVRAHNSKHRVDQFRDDVVVPGTKALSSVMRIQQLYIVTHGAHGSDAVFDDDENELKVTDLAQQLLDQKLTTSIGKVKLYCCNGGSGGVDSTAKQFKDAMRAKGFNNVSVYGYTFMLDQGGLFEGHKWAYGGLEDDAPNASAKSVRVKF